MIEELKKYIHNTSINNLADYLGLQPWTITSWLSRWKIPTRYNKFIIEWIETRTDEWVKLAGKIAKKIK